MALDLKSDFDSFVEGRLSDLVDELNRNNANYHTLTCKTKELREDLRYELDNATWQKVKELVRAHMQKGYIEGKYLYAKGILDCATLSVFLDREIISTDFTDTTLDDDF